MIREKKITSKIMASIKSKDTKPELLLGKAMWKLGLRYRKHVKVKGSPDFAFMGKKLAVFCDGDFWHGNNWRIRGMNSLEHELDSYEPYWKKKILTNIKRDEEVNAHLEGQGWTVIRFWSSKIIKDPDELAKEVKDVFDKL